MLQDRVGGGHFLEALVSGPFAAVNIRMISLRQLAKGLPDDLVFGVRRHPEHVIERRHDW